MKTFASTQKGMATLTVTILILLLLLLVSLFAVRLNLFEQRTAINENRLQLVSNVSEAALNQGLEFIKANQLVVASEGAAVGTAPAGWLAPGNVRWQSCATAAPAGQLDPCLSEPDPARRATMFRYNFAGSTALPLASLGVGQAFNMVGQFPVTYQVSALLCRLDISQPGNPVCSPTPPSESQVAITLVSEARLTSENAVARQRQVIATFRVISAPPNVPIVAANSISGLGSAEIVPNPNAGGVGVPLSIWSNGNVDVDTGGTFQTCHLGEWLGNFSAATGGPTPYDGITMCDKCTCKGLTTDKGLLSGKNADEGLDIMDRDGNTHGTLPDTSYFPQEPYDDPNNKFDDSMFEYTFGLDTTNEGSLTPRMTCVSDDNPGGNCEDQALIDLGARRMASCATLGPASSGLYWISGECSIDSQVGSPSNPVFAVIDGCVKANGNMTFFGLMYHRGRNCGSAPGFKANGGGQIYGAVVVQNGIDINGSVQFIYNQQVLNNLGNSPAFKRYGVVPGSWSDEACYDTDHDCRP